MQQQLQNQNSKQQYQTQQDSKIEKILDNNQSQSKELAGIQKENTTQQTNGKKPKVNFTQKQLECLKRQLPCYPQLTKLGRVKQLNQIETLKPDPLPKKNSQNNSQSSSQTQVQSLNNLTQNDSRPQIKENGTHLQQNGKNLGSQKLAGFSNQSQQNYKKLDAKSIFGVKQHSGILKQNGTLLRRNNNRQVSKTRKQPSTDFMFYKQPNPIAYLSKQSKAQKQNFLSTGIYFKYNFQKIGKDQYDCWMSQQNVYIQQQLQSLLESGTLKYGFAEGNNSVHRGDVKVHQKMIKYLAQQAALRNRLEKEQEDILNIQEKNYKKFVKECAKHRSDLSQSYKRRLQDQQNQLMFQVKKTRSQFTVQQGNKKDMRSIRNKAVMRLHERLGRETNKVKEDDRARRLEALKARDFDAYQQMLREKAGPQTGEEKFQEIEVFLRETEDYLNKLSYKVSNVKIAQIASEAAQKELQEAKRLGYTDHDANDLAKAVAQEKLVQATTDEGRAQFSIAGDTQNKYYSLAHAVEERVTKQPNMLKGPNGQKLRDYQVVGLQWMVSLYNNHLNGILADEMGLGKTVQVMALLAYLMERKNNYGPHMIIVPNAVIVNWRAELTRWLPDCRCIFYVGEKGLRHRLFQQEVYSLQFNILVTTYEYTMRDRSKLSKIQWQYIVIDEAQRMKNHSSRLSRDLTRMSCTRRLLLTGTPLQNDLQELWSLLNLLLPEVFDDKSQFASWFEDEDPNDENWMATEKRIVVINRLHQILEPFMLRRQVQDVERKLPAKDTITIKVPMSTYQSIIYNWIKETGTKRVDPLDPRAHKKGEFEPLQNKIVELRKVCNHPQLVHIPYDYDNETIEKLISESGKLCILDRVLVKLYQTGHKVLLFSTMTKLLDVVELYFRNRILPDGKQIIYRRIDGNTSLEDREDYIQQFNGPESDIFVFLLSIRAAGRGLNLQSSDTVIIYDPDPNPKNEEQAIARAHRIGQQREVKVIHLESVADPFSMESEKYKEGEGTFFSDKKYVDSVESLVRNTVQKSKIAIANEVIDAGGFDMQTSNDQRRANLEALLQDEDRFKIPTNQVLASHELNKMIARTPEELEIFDKLDKDLEWPGDPLRFDETPDWIKYKFKDIQNAHKYNIKNKSHTSFKYQNRLKELANEDQEIVQEQINEEESEEESEDLQRKSRRKSQRYQQYFDGEEGGGKEDKEGNFELDDDDFEEDARQKDDDEEFKTTVKIFSNSERVYKKREKKEKIRQRPMSEAQKEFLEFYHQNKHKGIDEIVQEKPPPEREEGEVPGEEEFEEDEVIVKKTPSKNKMRKKRGGDNPGNNFAKFNEMRRLQKQRMVEQKKKREEQERIRNEQRAEEKRLNDQKKRIELKKQTKEQKQQQQQKELEKLYNSIERKRKQTEVQGVSKVQKKKKVADTEQRRAQEQQQEKVRQRLKQEWEDKKNQVKVQSSEEGEISTEEEGQISDEQNQEYGQRQSSRNKGERSRRASRNAWGKKQGIKEEQQGNDEYKQEGQYNSYDNMQVDNSNMYSQQGNLNPSLDDELLMMTGGGQQQEANQNFELDQDYNNPNIYNNYNSQIQDVTYGGQDWQNQQYQQPIYEEKPAKLKFKRNTKSKSQSTQQQDNYDVNSMQVQPNIDIDQYQQYNYPDPQFSNYGQQQFIQDGFQDPNQIQLNNFGAIPGQFDFSQLGNIPLDNNANFTNPVNNDQSQQAPKKSGLKIKLKLPSKQQQ